MFSALTEVLQRTLTSMGTQLHEHSKCQMEQSESYNQANENSGEPASEEVTQVVSVAFKDTLSETAFKNLLTKTPLPENCKFAQAKLVYPVVFVSVSPSVRSTDIKLQEVQ